MCWWPRRHFLSAVADVALRINIIYVIIFNSLYQYLLIQLLIQFYPLAVAEFLIGFPCVGDDTGGIGELSVSIAMNGTTGESANFTLNKHCEGVL